MAGLTKRQKEAKKRQLPDYIPNEEEFKYYRYCVSNNIRISPMGTDQIGKWHIGISTPDSHRKVYNAPHIYDKDTIWIEYYKFCKYYYDQR